MKVKETNLLNDLDRKLIDECDKFGYDKIVVCCEFKKIKCSKYWSKRNFEFVVAESKNSNDPKMFIGGFPAIWDIVEKLNISGCCSNGNQAQLKNEHGLSKTAYEKINGEWIVVKPENILDQLSETYNI